MKRFLLVAACLVCVMAFATPSNAVILDSGDLIGTIVDGVPTGATDELAYITALVTEYNAGTAAGSSGSVLTETCNLYHTEDWFGVGDHPTPLVFGTKDDVAPFFTPPIDFTSGRVSTYLYAKYGGGQTGGYAALDYLNDYTSIEGISPTVPAGATAGLGLSHVSLYNPRAVPEPATVMLLGFGLAGIGTFRRFKKHC